LSGRFGLDRPGSRGQKGSETRQRAAPGWRGAAKAALRQGGSRPPHRGLEGLTRTNLTRTNLDDAECQRHRSVCPVPNLQGRQEKGVADGILVQTEVEGWHARARVVG